MRILFGLTLAIGLAACATAPADIAKTEGVQTASADNVDPNKPICRFTAGFGGAPGERICMTKEQWESHDSRLAASGEAVKNSIAAQRSTLTGPAYKRPGQ